MRSSWRVVQHGPDSLMVCGRPRRKLVEWVNSPAGAHEPGLTTTPEHREAMFRRGSKYGHPARPRDDLDVRLSSSGWRSPSRTWRWDAGRASSTSIPRCTSDTSPSMAPAPTAQLHIEDGGARHGRVVTTAVRLPVRSVRPATRGRRMVSMASAKVLAGRMEMSRRARLDGLASGAPCLTTGPTAPHELIWE
jgi:hypothetical protein